MRNFIILISLFSCVAFTISCEKNNKQDLADPISDCDKGDISFANDLIAEIDAKCNTSGCHNAISQAGGYNLEGYANVKAAIDGGRFQGAINQEPGFSPMPKSADKLDACYLLKLNKWIERGSNNN